jgi:hypothetical protein
VSGPGLLGPRQVMWSVVCGIWVAQLQRPSLSGWLVQRTVRVSMWSHRQVWPESHVWVCCASNCATVCCACVWNSQVWWGEGSDCIRGEVHALSSGWFRLFAVVVPGLPVWLPFGFCVGAVVPACGGACRCCRCVALN